MAENFTNFIIRLAEDPKTLAEFHKEPDAAAARAGLTPAEIEIFKSKNTRLIREAIVADIVGGGGASEADAAGITVVVITYTRMPSSIAFDRFKVGFDASLEKQIGALRGGIVR